MGAEADAEEAFGPYLVYERLGVGGMATVHRALERGIEGFERIVALKRLLPHLAEDATFIKAFVREAKLASALNHVNIVQIYELGRVNTEYFISMEHIDGRDIRRVLRHARKVTGAPPPNVTVGLLLQLCDALDYAHTKIDENGVPMGLVHRDVSPSNVLVTKSGSVKVIDFGIAKAQSSQHRTQTGRVKGKLAYMAPEAISGSKDLDARSDLFAVGVIAHELLTARPLFASKNEYQTLLKVQRGDIMPPSTFNQSVPAELDAIVLRALARDPDERFSSAAELRDELLALRHKYRMQTGVRDVSMWLDWAFTMDVPNDASAPVGDAPIADLAWGANEGSGSPIVLDEVPDVSQRIAMPASQPIREAQPRLFDEDPSSDVRDDDDDVDDIPTPAPQPPRRPSPAPARTTTSSRAATPPPARTTSSSRIVSPSSPPERRSSELLDALHAANDAAATLESMPAASAFGVETQPTGRGLAMGRVSTGQIERRSTNEIERPSLSELDDQTSVVTPRAPEAAPTDPALSGDDHITGENQADIDPTTGKSRRRAPTSGTTEDERDAVIDPPLPATTLGVGLGAASESPRPGTKLGVGRDAISERSTQGSKPGATRETVIERPQPGSKLGASRDAAVPSRDTPVPSRATPVPSRATPVPSRDTSIPLRDTPVPSRDTPVPSRTAIGVARNTPNPSVKTAPMIPMAPPQRPTPDLSRATPDPSVSTHDLSLSTYDRELPTSDPAVSTPDPSLSARDSLDSLPTHDPAVSAELASRRTGDIPRGSRKTGPEQPLDEDSPMVRSAATKPMGGRRGPHAPSLSTPMSEGSAATSAAASRPSAPLSLDEVPSIAPAAATSEPGSLGPDRAKKVRTKLGYQPARAATSVPPDDDDASATISSGERKRAPNIAASSIGMSIIERDARPNRTWLVLALIALVVGGAGAALYLTRTPKAPPAKPTEEKPQGTTGTVAVELEPTDAEISIDGTLVHTGSPWQTDLAAGSHSIEIHKQGYKAWLTTVNVTAGERQKFTVALAPLSGVSPGSASVTKQPGKAPTPTAPAPSQTPTTPAPTPHGAPGSDSHTDISAPTTNAVAQTVAPSPTSAASVTTPSVSASATAPSSGIPMATTLYAGTTPPPSAPSAAPSPVPAPSIATTAPAAAQPPPTAPAITRPAPPTTPSVATSTGPVTVAPSAVKKLSGELPELVSKNDVASVVAAKLCIDWQGSVSSVDLITKLEPRMALEMKKTLGTWKYAPYQAPSARVPSAACFAVSFRTK